MRPNILWITTHDINPDLGCYAGSWPGAEYARTPHLDALAAQGRRYDLAFAAAPICAPSRSAVMTGCFPTAIGTMHMRSKAVPPPEVRLLGEYFRAAGYHCTNNAFTDFQVPTPPTAFDECGPQAHWRGRPSPEIPFFAAFHGMVTHESQLYVDDAAFAEATRHVGDADRHDPAHAPVPPYLPDTPTTRRTLARYADLVTEADHRAGELLAQLDADGLARDTIVVFWSDHGRGTPRAKRWLHDSGLRVPLIVRWPGRVAPGGVHAEPVHLMDLAATMLAAVGLPVPAHLHATPFLDGRGDPVTDGDGYCFGGRDRFDEQSDTSRTVRDRRYRYIRHLHPGRPPMPHTAYPDRLATWAELRELAAEEGRQRGRGEVPDRLTPAQRALVAPDKPAEELYDLHRDPHEIRNLAGDPEHATDLTRLRTALDEWQARVGDLGLVPEDELAERWRPGGVWPQADAPEVTERDGLLDATCATPGASIGWTYDPPGTPEPPSPMDLLTGAPERDGRRWNLHTGPFRPRPGALVHLRAWRLGLLPSPEVTGRLEHIPEAPNGRSATTAPHSSGGRSAPRTA